MMPSQLSSPVTRSWLTRLPSTAALGMMGFLPPVFGFLPRSCDPHGPGGPGAGEAGAAGANDGGSNDGGAGGAAEPPSDRVVEPLLGCVTGVSGKQTPGAFDLIESFYDFGQPADQPWLTDWSGDGQTAIGVYTNEPFDDAYGAFFVRWNAETGWELDEKIRIELSQFHETPTARISCDGSVRLWLDGDGTVSSTNPGLAEAHEPQSTLSHGLLLLSENGQALGYRASISESVRPWAYWQDSNGNSQGLSLETVYSLSWDGLTAFGISSCYYYGCTWPKTFRWRPLDGITQIDTTAPTAYVAADGETIVYNDDETHLGLWREASTQLIDCVEACQAIAWSATAKVLLVRRNDAFWIWTQPHGFRPVAELLAVPEGTEIVPTGLSLDGWTVHGTASTTEVPFAYFRATLKAGAFQ